MTKEEARKKAYDWFEKDFINALVERKFDDDNIATSIGFTPYAVDYDWGNPEYLDIIEELEMKESDLEIKTDKISSNSCNIIIKINKNDINATKIVADLYEDILHKHNIDSITNIVCGGWFIFDKFDDSLWIFTPSFNVNNLQIFENYVAFNVDIHINRPYCRMKSSIIDYIVKKYDEDSVREFKNSVFK